MKFYHVYTTFQEHYKGEEKIISHGYFKSLFKAWEWCNTINEECGNNSVSWEIFLREMEDFATADIGCFTVDEIGFMDEDG